jgi:hypothetical protein
MPATPPAPPANPDLDCDRVVLEASALPPPDDSAADVPVRVLVAPWGEVKSTAGAFLVDERAAQTTIAAFRDHGTDLPIDYEHQTLGGSYSAPDGLAPAAGWIKALKLVTPQAAALDGIEPGLWADVSWTPDARTRLAAREYRYLSPVALVRRADRRLVALHSVALTNKPAIVGMKPVVSRSGVPGLEPSPESLPTAQSDGTAAGDALTAPAPPACNRFDGADAAADNLVLITLRDVLSLQPDATAGTVLLAALARLRSLENAERERVAEDRVARATGAGKLTHAQRDWALALARRDPTEFDRWAETAPCVVLVGRIPPPIDGSFAVRGDHRVPADTARRPAMDAARREWRANRAILEKLCTEDAYAADAVRMTARAADGDVTAT